MLEILYLYFLKFNAISSTNQWMLYSPTESKSPRFCSHLFFAEKCNTRPLPRKRKKKTQARSEWKKNFHNSIIGESREWAYQCVKVKSFYPSPKIPITVINWCVSENLFAVNTLSVLSSRLSSMCRAARQRALMSTSPAIEYLIKIYEIRAKRSAYFHYITMSIR